MQPNSPTYDLYKYASWQARKPYIQCVSATPIWNKLCERFGAIALMEAMEQPSKLHNKLQEAFRDLFVFPKYNPNLDWQEPTPTWIGLALQTFVKWYYKRYPDCFDRDDEDLAAGSGRPALQEA